ncbi:MAG: arylsulfatase [Candidatus Hydrogenedentes bacterium]|nr:arylsulfatase [Candidatus Hydrogenedentota bacterium]
MSTPSRREFIQQSAMLAVGASTFTTLNAQQVAPNEKRPNVLIILTDDHGYGDLGCHGNPYVKTPSIDRLHGESTRLTQYHHSPVCTPTRASLMTGRYNYRTCAIDTFRGRAMMHPNEVTIAEMFSFAGYKTGIFGKWHLGDCFPMRACDRGFQESLVLRGGGLKQPSEFPGCGGYFDPILMRDGKPEPHKGYCTDIFATETIAFMERHKDEPFFVYLPTNAPHTPLIVDDKYAEPYLKMGLDEKTAKFYGMVANIDENIGRVLDAIDRLGIRDNTIVLFMTDNGTQAPADAPRFNANMRGQKGTVYEGGIRVPCFVRWPGKIDAGKDVDRLTAHVDIAPTLLELCGIQALLTYRFDGRSAAPLLTGNSTEWPDRTLFFQWHRGDVPEPYNNCCARTQRYKLVNGVELYDLEADPAEANDVAARHPDIVQKLRTEYETWFGDVSATRGYEPPEIVIGDEHSNPVYLTVQDMRSGEGGGYGSNGFWKTRFARDGVYDVTLRFNKEVNAGTANVQIGGVLASAPIAAGTDSTVIKGIRLYSGPASVRAWANKPEPANGAQYVDIALTST